MCKKIFNETKNDKVLENIKEIILKLSKRKGFINGKA